MLGKPSNKTRHQSTIGHRPVRTLIIGARDSLDSGFVTPLRNTGSFQILHVSTSYPDHLEIQRIVRLYAPDIMMLSFDDPQKAFGIAEALLEQEPALPVVALNDSFHADDLIQMIRLGVREVVTLPLSEGDANELALKCTEITSLLSRAHSDDSLVLSFLPSKPGVGASTVAANVALAMSEGADSKTLLVDFDLQAGLLAYMLKLSSEHSLADLIHRADDLDEVIWRSIVGKRGNLDVLASGRLGLGTSISPAHAQLVIDFAKRYYRNIFADLSGALEPYSVDLLRSSRKIFLVTTPEIPALHLARERYAVLRDLGLAEQTALILNRWQNGSLITLREIEQTVGAPIFTTLPNDYRTLHKALLGGKPLREGSPIAKEIRGLARKLVSEQHIANGSSPGAQSERGRLHRLMRRLKPAGVDSAGHLDPRQVSRTAT